jgi:hypothetical protein
MSSFLDEADFDAMREAMSLFDEQRDTVIKRSRDITKASKVAIYCLHRGEMEKADAQIAQALAAADELTTVVEANPQLRNSGSYSGGLGGVRGGGDFRALHPDRDGASLRGTPEVQRRRVPGRHPGLHG